MLHIEELGLDDFRRPEALAMILQRHVDHSRQLGEAVSAFVKTAGRQGLKMDRLLLACLGGERMGACVSLESPGSSALVMCSPAGRRGEIEVSRSLLEKMREVSGRDGVRLLQCLIRPEEHLEAKALAAAGYRYLAELDYMECPVRGRTAGSCQAGMKVRTYGQEAHGLFLECLEASYEETMDCPGLAGVRDPEQVLCGHRATGLYDPQLWYVLTLDDAPAGILLLSRVSNRNVLEVVYIGVAKRFRGRGLGDRMLSLAFQRADQHDAEAITLAVDNTNQPALGLYRRWGFRRVSSRRAWIAVNET